MAELVKQIWRIHFTHKPQTDRPNYTVNRDVAVVASSAEIAIELVKMKYQNDVRIFSVNQIHTGDILY